MSPIGLREVTAADRAAATVRLGERTPPPAYGGHLPFQGRLGVTCIRRHMLMHMTADASTPHVRGGSVSRRGLTQRQRRYAQLAGGTNSEEATAPNASRSSGEGVWGGGASLREAASSPESRPHKSLREGARGRSFSQRSCLPRITPPVPFPCSYFLPFYFYFVAKFIRTICTQALPNDWFCRTIGARSRRGGYLG